jgi:hypothetical protein
MMKRSRSVVTACMVGVLTMVVASVLFPAFGAGPQGTIYQITVPKQGALIANPVYYCWLPESVSTYRCIIVHLHGCTMEATGPQMTSDVQWTTFAKKWNAVFISPSLATGSDCTNWTKPENGSGNTFLAVLDSLARRSGHPEITIVPWALWGHSGGSDWVSWTTAQHPERVAVGVCQASGKDISSYPAVWKVPVLHHNSKVDLIYNNDSLFLKARAKGALWAHAINPFPQFITGPGDPASQGHGAHDMRMIAIPWMDYALTSRLPDNAGSAQLKDMDTSNAWLGDTLTYAIASAATFTGDKLKACWFPNQTFAKLWAEYMVKGTIKDSTPFPPTPYNLTGIYSNKQITLNWDAEADMETGIKTFIIYRNGSVLQTIQYPNAPATPFSAAKGFQRWDYGDQPNPTAPPNMTFTDATVSDTGTYLYQVSTVNWSDVAGPKSAPIALSRGLVTGTRTISQPSATATHTSMFLCSTIGKRVLNLSPGMVDVFDIRGRLIKSLEIRRAIQTNVEELLGALADKVLLIRNRGRQVL